MDTYCGICGGLDHDTWDEGWHVSEQADGTLVGTMSQAKVERMTEAEHVAAAYRDLLGL